MDIEWVDIKGDIRTGKSVVTLKESGKEKRVIFCGRDEVLAMKIFEYYENLKNKGNKNG